jgi:hypothetical protein
LSACGVAAWPSDLKIESQQKKKKDIPQGHTGPTHVSVIWIRRGANKGQEKGHLKSTCASFLEKKKGK